MARPEQQGIKWWKTCPVCQWAARSKGVAGEQDNARVFCPNCNNPSLDVEVDDHVFDEKRYDVRVRNSQGQAVADEVRQNQGKPPAPADTDNRSNPGHQYGNDPKPFPPPP